MIKKQVYGVAAAIRTWAQHPDKTPFMAEDVIRLCASAGIATNRNSVVQALAHMKNDGLLVRLGPGLYIGNPATVESHPDWPEVIL